MQHVVEEEYFAAEIFTKLPRTLIDLLPTKKSKRLAETLLFCRRVVYGLHPDFLLLCLGSDLKVNLLNLDA